MQKKKITAFLLALAMVSAMALPVFAQEPNPQAETAASIAVVETATPETAATEEPKVAAEPAEDNVKEDAATYDAPPENGWYQEYPGGPWYWYENGVRQGTTGRGKEIYDPASDAWYWLDAVDGGAKAVNKDVYQESDGGKWVRYDENGHMIKGENCQNGNWYYFEPVTGAMIHGPWTLPDGRKVYYDLTTGIMQYGNVSINGSLYYFDPVYGTMKSGALTNFWVTDGNGKSFWYESWVRQGWQPGSSNYRGKEIYDPASGAWYWLDNVQQGAKATSKEVYQDSNGGKWVRYDANGHMIKGWYTQDGKTWYYDLTTGAMYKGWHTIEGSTYHFDETTGVKG